MAVLRVAMRGLMIVLALVFAVASAAAVLCEMNCAADGHAESLAAKIDGAANPSSHCDGEQIDSTSPNTPNQSGSNSGNTKHSGAHSHLRIVATVRAEVQISPAIALSDFSVAPAVFSAAIFSRNDQNLWNNNSSPPINSPAVFSTGVLRI